AGDADRRARGRQSPRLPPVVRRRRQPGLRAVCVLAEDVVEERAMGSMTRCLDTQQAFDAVAADYDRSNAANPTLCAMRRRAWHAVNTFVPRGSHILDLGCGP